MKNGMQQDTVMEEPGAEDNRLSLDPNAPEFKFASEWEDGKDYNVILKVRQISPGEFEVIEGTEGDAAEGEADQTDETDQWNEGETATGRNPAIQEAIKRRYSK